MAKAHTLIDNFNDNAINTSLWAVTPTGSDIREVNGRIEIRPPGNQTSGSYPILISQADYDLTDSEVRVELVRTLIRSTRTSTSLAAIFNTTSALTMVVYRGMLACSVNVSGSTTVLAEQPYDAQHHRWLRLREERNTIFWEVSDDGADWGVLATLTPHTFDLTAVKLRLAAGTSQPVTAPGVAIFDNFNVLNSTLSRRVEQRRLSARDVRDRAAELAAERRHEEHANNNDEVSYPERRFVGNYSKSLKHDSFGDPDPGSYATMLRALQSEDPADFEKIDLSSTAVIKLTNPQAGLAFDIEGPDAQAYTLPPAPRFDSETAAHEAGELYWMAVARDVHFSSYTAATPPADITAAINSLNNEFPQFGGTMLVTGQNLFRGIYPGEQVGPYVSQFLLKGNNDPRKPDGTGRDANEGYITYGSQVIDQRQLTVRGYNATTNPNPDYLTTFASWLSVQNGADTRGADQFDTTRRFIRNLRDGASYVHFDQVVNAFYNTAMILLSEPEGNQLTFQSGVTGRPMVDAEFPKDQGNPYTESPTQAGFATFGPIHLLQVLSEVTGRALRATWWQKWGVHRRLRPEEYGGRVHNQILWTSSNGMSGRNYDALHGSIANSLRTGALAPYFGQTGERYPQSHLLPQAYPEGAPTHPAYGAGHATGAGAMATILKAFFDENHEIANPVLASSDGLSLVAYTPPGGEAPLTVGGELNKLAGNIALFRSAAGVHWRSDYSESLPFGEAIAIGLLQEMSLGFNEDDGFFQLTRFDGQKIRIFDGKVMPVV